MKHIFVLSILSFIFIIFIGCSEQKAQSYWLNKTISVDGNGEDWKDIPLTYNEDLMLVYGFANNDTSLNLLIRFRDPGLVHKLSRRGMTLWFNENNEKERIFGIHYIDKSVRSPQPGMEGDSGKNLAPNQRSSYKQQTFVPTGTFSLVQRDSISGGIDIKNVRGLEGAAGYENGLYCFEFRVNLNESEKTIHSISVPGDGKIKACLEISPMSEEEKERMKEMSAQQGGRGSHDGGMKGGGRGGHGGGRGGSRMQALNTDGDEIWITVILAGKNKP